MNDDHELRISRRCASGFTLIELMVTMSIMAILAAAMAYVMAGAQETAQIAKTRTLIARLHTLVTQKYESYRYRRLPVTIPPGLSPPMAAQVRCDAIRQLMRMEMPERWTDIKDDPVPITNPTTGTKTIVMQRPACSQAYLAFFNSINIAANTAFQQDPTHYQGAKCLYLLVTMGLEDTDVMENFSEGDIADFDKTGCKVFLDAWGNPIEFLRWAPGLVSSLQPGEPGSGDVPATAKDLRMPDQTDPTGFYGIPGGRIKPRKQDTFALYPLIYSAGPDGYYDTVTGTVHSGGAAPCEEVLSPSNVVVFSYSKATPPNNPFFSVSDKMDFTDGPIGFPQVYPSPKPRPAVPSRALGVSDNIHNHTIGAR